MLLFNVSYQRGVLKSFFIPVRATEKMLHALKEREGERKERILLCKLFFPGFFILSLEDW